MYCDFVDLEEMLFLLEALPICGECGEDSQPR